MGYLGVNSNLLDPVVVHPGVAQVFMLSRYPIWITGAIDICLAYLPTGLAKCTT